MTRECYYLDQSGWSHMDFVNLYRFLYRMVQYRNDVKGSFDGKKRIEEIRSIDLSRLSIVTKQMLLRCINSNHATELLKLDNLAGLSDETEYDIFGRHRENGTGHKLSGNDFYDLIKELNELIRVDISSGVLPQDYYFEIRCIGGFAMSYHRIRENGMTEGMDSLVEIADAIKKRIREISEKRDLAYDWINDTMLKFGYHKEDFSWEEVNWFLGKNSRIRVFVCSVEDLLRNKIGFAEKYLENEKNTDRGYEIDYEDTLALLDHFGIRAGIVPGGFAYIRLLQLGLSVEDYPHLKDMFCPKGEEEDDAVFLSIYRLDSEKMEPDEFIDFIEGMGMTKEEFWRFYGKYLSSFPKVRDLLNQI